MPLIRADAAGAPAPPPADSEFLVTALTSQDAGARRRAAHELGGLAAQAGAEAKIIEALATQLQTENNTAVREAIFAALGQIGGAHAAALLAPLLRLEDAGLRNGALETLKRLADAAVSAVDPLLADQDADVRLLAVEVMRGWKPDRAVPRLAAILASEQQVNVVGAAVDVALQAGDASLLPALVACAARFAGAGYVEFAIAMAVQALTDRSAVHVDEP